MIYLASPYSHPDPAVREQRFRDVCRVTAALLKKGELVFSPIVHSHPLTQFGLPPNWEFWEKYDRSFLMHCDDLRVLMLRGWTESEGVAAEMRLAKELGKPISFICEKDYVYESQSQ